MNKTKKIVLCVGHYEKEKGAVNPETGITEWGINQPLVEMVSRQLIVSGWNVTVIDNLSLPRKIKAINSIKTLLTIDFHCNAFDKNVQGNEALYFYKSIKGRLLASCITDMISFNRSRGIKPVENEDGSYFCRNTKPTAIVLETCFIDNQHDFYRFLWSMEQTAKEIVNGISSFYNFSDVNSDLL